MGFSSHQHGSEALCVFKRHKLESGFKRPVIKNLGKVVGGRLVSSEHK